MGRAHRVIFVGTVRASLVALEAIMSIRSVELVGIITKKRSGFNSDHVDLSTVVDQTNVPCRHVKDINAPHIHEWIRSLQPDVVFVSGWSQLLAPTTLSIATHGAIGFHPALLPKNRGRHPLIWAIILGLRETGATFFVMDEHADSGRILSQEAIPIESDETANTLYRKVESSMRRQIPQFLPAYLSGSLRGRPQENAGNTWRKRSRGDGTIDFRMTSVAIDRLVRALSRPYPGAEIEYRGTHHVVWSTRLNSHAGDTNIEPGRILSVDSGKREITIKTGDGAITLVEHEWMPLPIAGEYV